MPPQNELPPIQATETETAPEIAALEAAIVELNNKEAQDITEEAVRQPLSAWLLKSANDLKKHDPLFKELLAKTFMEHVEAEHDLSMDIVIREAFKKYQQKSN